MRNLDQGVKTGRKKTGKKLDFEKQSLMHIFKNFVNQQPILHYTLVIGCCTTLQKIFDKITADTGLSKGYKEDVHYMDVKEYQSTFVKNVMLDCIQTVLKDTIFLKYSEYKRLYTVFA